MRSAARLTYEQVQAAHRRQPESRRSRHPCSTPLYGAFAALDRARATRAARSRSICRIRASCSTRTATSVAHRAAAAARQPQIDRGIHDRSPMSPRPRTLETTAPALPLPRPRRARPEQLDALREFLADIDIPGLELAKGQVIRPRAFNRVLAQVAGRPEAAVVNDLVLRAPGAGGLQPRQYRPFRPGAARATRISPRRSGATPICWCIARCSARARRRDALEAIGKHVSATERRATAAERAALERYRARLLGGRIGEVFAGAGQRRAALRAVPDAAPTAAPMGFCRSPTCRPISIASMRAGRASAGAIRAAASGSATRFRYASPRPIRSAAGSVFRLDEAVAERPRFSASRRRKRAGATGWPPTLRRPAGAC